MFLFTPPDLSGYSTFSGNYADLSGLPTLFSGDYADLTNTPTTSDNIQLSLTGTTTLNLVNGDDNSIIDSVNLNTITSGLSYNDLDDLPQLVPGNYNDLTNKPTIPSRVVMLQKVMYRHLLLDLAVIILLKVALTLLC